MDCNDTNETMAYQQQGIYKTSTYVFPIFDMLSEDQMLDYLRRFQTMLHHRPSNRVAPLYEERTIQQKHYQSVKETDKNHKCQKHEIAPIILSQSLAKDKCKPVSEDNRKLTILIYELNKNNNQFACSRFAVNDE